MNLSKLIKKAILKIIQRGHWYSQVEFRDCRKFWEYNTFDTDVMVIGSASGAHAFNFDGIPIKGVNFAMSANPQCADLAILKSYHSYLNSEKSTVIITLCPFSALSGNYEYLADKYYTILPPPAMPVFYYWKKQAVYKKMRSPLQYYPLFALISDIKYFALSWRKITLSESEMEENARQLLDAWMKEFSWQSFDAPLSVVNKDGKQEAIRLLNETIIFCKERNISPVIIFPPMYHTLSDKFTPNARHILFESLIENVEDKSVPFFNYMDDADFSNDRSLFKNSFLLNEKGSKVFTKRVLLDLNLI